MYDLDALGKYENAFGCVCEAVNSMVSEFTKIALAKFEIGTDENDEPTYDVDQFERIMINIAAVDAKAELLKDLFYKGYKLLNAKEVADERSNEKGSETV